jgi:YbgC/YbaW family acyl-CoA thioester hydrolase
MNLLLRLIALQLLGTWRTRCDVLGPCLTPFRVAPTDLDVLGHMNNGIYFSLLDLARVDLMRRSGLLSRLSAKGWYPVVVAETIQFRKSLRLLQRFDIETRVLGWDAKAFVIAQRFLRDSDEVAAAVIRARLLKKQGGTVAPADVLALADKSTASPDLPAWVAQWNSLQASRAS